MLAKLVNIAPITVVYNVYDTYHYSCIVGFTNQQTQLGAQSYLSCPGGACMENGGNKGFPQQRALRTCGWTPCSTGICLGVTVKKMVGRLAAYRNVGKKKNTAGNITGFSYLSDSVSCGSDWSHHWSICLDPRLPCTQCCSKTIRKQHVGNVRLYMVVGYYHLLIYNGWHLLKILTPCCTKITSIL